VKSPIFKKFLNKRLFFIIKTPPGIPLRLSGQRVPVYTYGKAYFEVGAPSEHAVHYKGLYGIVKKKRVFHNFAVDKNPFFGYNSFDFNGML